MVEAVKGYTDKFNLATLGLVRRPAARGGLFYLVKSKGSSTLVAQFIQETEGLAISFCLLLVLNSFARYVPSSQNTQKVRKEWCERLTLYEYQLGKP